MTDGAPGELDEADVSALKEMAQWWRESGMTRRAALGLAGGATLGAATGGGFLTGRASAQADANDSDGDIGAPGDRVDIFADGIDANSLAQTSATFDSISTGELAGDNITITQDTISSVTYHSGNFVSVDPNAFRTIFNVTGTTHVIGGIVTGNPVNQLRATWDDGTTDTIYSDGRLSGADSNGDENSVLSVPPILDVSELEFKNDGSTTSTVGWEVMTI